MFLLWDACLAYEFWLEELSLLASNTQRSYKLYFMRFLEGSGLSTGAAVIVAANVPSFLRVNGLDIPLNPRVLPRVTSDRSPVILLGEI